MSTWNVVVNGKNRTVRMDSPAFGRKVIYIDGQQLKKVGTLVSMWANYKFDIDGRPAVIKFRAIKRTKGMSLYVDNEFVAPEPGGEWSAEAVQWMMLAAFLVIISIPLAAVIF